MILDVSNSYLLLQIFWGWHKLYYDSSEPFMKVMLLNEIVKHPLFKLNLILEIFLIHFRFFNIHIIQ